MLVGAAWALEVVGQQVVARFFDARDNQASWISSANSVLLISASRLARTNTEGCPSKWSVVKNGETGSENQRQLVAFRFHPEHDHVRIALAGVRIGRIGPGRAEEHERFPAHLVDRIALRTPQALDVRHRGGDLMHVA